MDAWSDMLDELLNDDSDTMTAWEVEFIESLNKQRRAPAFEPSEKQRRILLTVWQNVFA